MSYSDSPIYELLQQASRGRIGVDQRLIRAHRGSRRRRGPDLLKFGMEDHLDDPVGLELDLVQVFRILRTPKALDYYVRLVQVQPYDLPDELVEAFTEIGPSPSSRCSSCTRNSAKKRAAKSPSCWPRSGSRTTGSSRFSPNASVTTPGTGRFCSACTRTRPPGRPREDTCIDSERCRERAAAARPRARDRRTGREPGIPEPATANL